MQIKDSLPEPSTEQATHSLKVQQYLQQQIDDARGMISFQAYMHSALYAPGLGYYDAGSRKLGAEGDFITAPEISPLFSQSLANQCQQILASIKNGSILEFGAGSGKMAIDILQALEANNALPKAYYILEVSPDLRQRQQQRLAEKLPHLASHIHWLNHLPKNFKGVVLANEVLDAMPVSYFVMREHEVFERYVSYDETGFIWQEQAAQNQLKTAVEALTITTHSEIPYTSECNLQLQPWLNSLADSIQQGVVLLIDYGYPAHEYYHPQRHMGTLVCHYRHRVHNDPLAYIGLQDITASVDFTAVADAGIEADFDLLGYTHQAAFLSGNGLEQCFIQALEKQPEQQYVLAQAVRTLTLPSEMGERFKVMALGKNYALDLAGFTLLDISHKL